MGVRICRVLLVLIPLVLGSAARAHVPDRLLIHLWLAEETWEASCELDIRFAVVALMKHNLPPDTGSGWLENLNPGQLGLLREVVETLFRNQYHLLVGENRAPMEFEFPDFEKTPLKFADGDNKEPVLMVRLRGEYPEERGDVSVQWKARWGPKLALMKHPPGQAASVVNPVQVADLGETVDVGEQRGSGKPVEKEQLGSQPDSPSVWARSYGGMVHLLLIVAVVVLATNHRALWDQMLALLTGEIVAFILTRMAWIDVSRTLLPVVLAASAAYLATENLVVRKVSGWRLGIVCGIGLLHGVGISHLAAALAGGPAGFVPALSVILGVLCLQVVIAAVLFVLLDRGVANRHRVRVRTGSNVTILVSALVLAALLRFS